MQAMPTSATITVDRGSDVDSPHAQTGSSKPQMIAEFSIPTTTSVLPDRDAVDMRPSISIPKTKRGTLQRVLSSGSVSSDSATERRMHLELEDGTVYQGYSFGAEKSIGGELVFQTGMVGYPESITDPSYRGQILVVTFPLVGNYGVPSRHAMDDVLHDIPAYFEASQIHIAGLVVASYSGEDFSHFLAESSLSTWLKEQAIPAMHGVDTRALTKRIREDGSMLGKMLVETRHKPNGIAGKHTAIDRQSTSSLAPDWRRDFKDVDWFNPNTKNLVAEGGIAFYFTSSVGQNLTITSSLGPRATPLQTTREQCVKTSFGTNSPDTLR